jgi:SAM-dependent methyltransferase
VATRADIYSTLRTSPAHQGVTHTVGLTERKDKELMSINDTYEEFFERANKSVAFSRYCSEVFFLDLTQDGFSDKEQLDLLIELSGINQRDTCLDIGCGNGRIDQYLHSKTGAQFHGVDFSKSAILNAKKIMIENEGLSFENGDINCLDVPTGRYTKIILIDSIYFSDDYLDTLCHLYDSLRTGGTLCLCYSEFVFDRDRQTRKILANETRIHSVAIKLGCKYRVVDLTDRHFELMKRKNVVSDKYRDEFLAEGNGWLYDKVHTESTDPTVSLVEFEKFTNRYIYCIDKGKDGPTQRSQKPSRQGPTGNQVLQPSSSDT